MMFDTFLIVDWSAARMPKTGRDSIWICRHGPDGETSPTRRPGTRREGLLAEMMAAAMTKGERVLLGFDFPFGYPAGFRRAARASTGVAVARDLGRDRRPGRGSRGQPQQPLRCRRRAQRAGVGRLFPFWGCPARMEHDIPRPKHHRRHEASGLPKSG